MSAKVRIGPQLVRARQTKSFAQAGVNGSNTNSVLKVSPTEKFLSNVFGDSIPQITGFEQGDGYLLDSKIDREDLTQILDVLSGGEVLLDENAERLTDESGEVITGENPDNLS